MTQASVIRSGNTPPVTVLIVDDVPDNRMLMRLLLQAGGYKSIECENGKEAVDLMRSVLSVEIRVILMDMQMPVLDGYGATRELRRLGFTRPIIAVTAHALASDKARCLEAGCDAYITKPIDRGLLLGTIKRQMDAPRAWETVQT